MFLLLGKRFPDLSAGSTFRLEQKHAYTSVEQQFRLYIRGEPQSSEGAGVGYSSFIPLPPPQNLNTHRQADCDLHRVIEGPQGCPALSAVLLRRKRRVQTGGGVVE